MFRLALLLATAATAAAAVAEAGEASAPHLPSWRSAVETLSQTHTPGVPASWYESALRTVSPSLLSSSAFCSSGAFNASETSTAPNLFIGTGGCGYSCAGLSPYAQSPYGTVRAGPDTSLDWLRLPWKVRLAPSLGRLSHPPLLAAAPQQRDLPRPSPRRAETNPTHAAQATGGYSYADTHVRAFSHTHLAGAGALGLGNVGLMPAADASEWTVQCVPDVLGGLAKGKSMRACNYRAPFSHEREEASPGRYSVVLNVSLGASVNATVTAAPFAAVHRYEWSAANASSTRDVVLDVCHSVALDDGRCRNAAVTVNATSGEVYGGLQSLGSFEKRFGGFPLFFTARFSEPLDAAASGVWSNNTLWRGRHALAGDISLGALLSFGAGAAAVEVRIGFSYLSLEQARANLAAQAGDGATLASVSAAAAAAWAAETGPAAAAVEGGTAANRLKFRSALYRCAGVPTRLTEEGGAYLGFGARAQKADGYQYYTDLSIWDTFRSHFPMLVLLRPSVAGDVMRSMMAMDDAAGRLPKWALVDGDANSMIGLHSAAMLADGLLGGVPGFDAADLLERAARSVRAEEGAAYLRLGYSASRPSVTVAFALDDFCVAQLARAAGNATALADFNRTAQFWRNTWNDDAKFFCPRAADGSWQECGTPLFPLSSLNPFDKYYTEGDAWHWRWSVMQDWPALVAAFGSPDAFVTQLDAFFAASEADKLRALPNPMYWAGNEEDIHAAYGFLFAGRPDLTQKYARRAMEERYKASSDGLTGNSDYAALDSWLVLSAAGLYPQTCGGRWLLGSPLFDRVSFARPGGNLTVLAHGNGPEAVYVTRVLLNGAPVDGWSVSASALASEAVLEFFMTEVPPVW